VKEKKLTRILAGRLKIVGTGHAVDNASSAVVSKSGPKSSGTQSFKQEIVL